MVLASPRPPVDPDDVNALTGKKYLPDLFQVAIEIRYPVRTRTTVFTAKRHCIPQIFKMQYLHK